MREGNRTIDSIDIGRTHIICDVETTRRGKRGGLKQTQEYNMLKRVLTCFPSTKHLNNALDENRCLVMFEHGFTLFKRENVTGLCVKGQ